MTTQQLTIAGMMITIIILFLLLHFSWRQRSRLGDLLQLARDEARDVYESYQCLKGNMEIETRTHRLTRGELEEARKENRDLASTLKAMEAKCESLDRKLSEMVVGRSIYENEVRVAVEKGEKVPVRGPVRGCESSSAEANRSALGQVDKRRISSPPPAPAGRYYDPKSDSYVRGPVDDGSGLLQTAALVSAFDNSPVREKEITDAQDSSHRSAGHQPVCQPSYESRHSGGAGESHSSHSSSDSGSSSSSDSGSSGSCD